MREMAAIEALKAEKADKEVFGSCHMQYSAFTDTTRSSVTCNNFQIHPARPVTKNCAYATSAELISPFLTQIGVLQIISVERQVKSNSHRVRNSNIIWNRCTWVIMNFETCSRHSEKKGRKGRLHRRQCQHLGMQHRVDHGLAEVSIGLPETIIAIGIELHQRAMSTFILSYYFYRI